MPTVNLKWPLIIAIVLAVLGVLAGAGPQLTDMGLDAHQVKAFQSAAGLLLAVGNAIQGVLIAAGMTSASRIAAVKELPLATRAQSFASDPAVAKVVLKEQAAAEEVPSPKVVGPADR